VHQGLQPAERIEHDFGFGISVAPGIFGQEGTPARIRRERRMQRLLIVLAQLVRRSGRQHRWFARHGHSVPGSLSIDRLDSASLRLAPAWRSPWIDGDMAGFSHSFGFATRLAVFYAALFALTGVQLPFFPVWLKAKGLDPALIGLVLAFPMVARIVAVPVATRAADRRDAIRATLVTTSLASLAGYALLGFAEGDTAVLVAFALVSLVFTPVMPLAETYALRGLAARGRAYGPVRLWGSAAFIAGTFAAGFVADLLPARDLIWLIVAASAGLALAATVLAPLAISPWETSGREVGRRGLLRDPSFIAVVTAASLIQASHAVYYGFSALAWRADGFSGAAIAALWALGVIAEIALFAVQGRLPPLFQPTVLLFIGGVGAAVRWAAMAVNPPAAVLPLLQVLHALSFGATHLGALTYIARHAPVGQAATAQGYLSIALGLAMAGSIAVSGWLFDTFNARAYAAMALLAVAGGVCVLVTRRGGIAGA
jgi:PPP family 3-phenylpropionic acid transporter